MHSRFRSKGVLLTALVAMVVGLLAVPTSASAEPQPGAKKRGFRLFARALGAMTINRIYCGLASDGRVCVDSTNSSTIGGGFWPKGTADQYVFNSGMQVAGIVGTDGGPWAGDTVGGFFFDPKGTTEHGEEVQPIYNASNPSDFSAWPDQACVPNGDKEETLFDPLLRTDPANLGNPACRRSASQGDVWWMSWEGNPALNAGRSHPLGIAVETRGLGWNFPAGNEDILYFIYTFYNVTSGNPADYAGIRPQIRGILQQKGVDFQQLNNAKFGITLPPDGYTITNLFAAFAADMDVAEAGSNFASVNLPFALGYTYDHSFSQPPGWTFAPSIFQAPFFQGSGFVGVKYLASPDITNLVGPGEIQLFSNTINGRPFAGAVNDPRDTKQLFRYLSGTLNPALGDDPCNTGNPIQTRICFINNNSPRDMRFFQSSTGLDLPPGGYGSVVVGYIFAAPVKTGGCGITCDVFPGDPRVLNNTTALRTTGANTIDTLSGFVSYADLNNDLIATQNEFTVVPGSLLGKSLVAQAVFDNKFLLPFAPDPPDFFLIPGDHQVTVLWQPSPSEANGDPFFAIANKAQVPDPANPAVLVANPLYDPNYRQKDVEGYRIYRGRVDDPGNLTLLAQFDFTGTVISDFTGQVNPIPDCAPELAINTGCAVPFAPNLKDGTTLTDSVDIPLVGDVIQVKSGDRSALASGNAILTKSDTLMTGQAAVASGGPFPKLSDNGVPYVFVDPSPRNNFRYFYSVVSFDVNSIESGPTSLESQRRTKSVTPVKPASNSLSNANLTVHVVGGGRDTATTPGNLNGWVRGSRNMDVIFPSVPTLDATNGTFSGPMPPADGAVLGFVGQFAKQVVQGTGALSARLLAMTPGQYDYTGCCAAGPVPVPITYSWRAFAGTDSVSFTITVSPEIDAPVSGNSLFPALSIDDALASRYGGSSAYKLQAQLEVTQPQIGYVGGAGFATGLGFSGFTSADFAGLGYTAARYNGARWFDGPSPAQNETFADPIQQACGTGISTQCASTTSFSTAGWTNAGSLSNVARIYQPMGYTMFNREWRAFEAFGTTVRRAADYNVFWGTGGVIDSVMDVTHDVVVPYAGTGGLGANWAVLNTANQGTGSFDGRPTVLTPLDWFCVEPVRTLQGLAGTTANGDPFFPCTSAAGFPVSNTASLGLIAFGAGNNQSTTAAQSSLNPANVQPGPGFSLYVAGTVTFFEMAALPAAGTVWSLRDYAGLILGGKGGPAGNQGPYKFLPATRPFTAVGAEVSVVFDVANQVRNITGTDLKKVHTVPDPYYVTSEFEQSTDNKVIKFVNLPEKAIIRIYSSSGVLVNILEHNSTTFGGEETWNVRNRNNQVVASGVYFYHIEAVNPNGQPGTARRVGRFTIVNFAQ